MAHLTDMEELVASVENNEIRDYMSESLSCYMAGAYRASVVLTFIALFDDVLSKLTQLGKVNKKAKTISDEAAKRRADQEVFETYLIDQLKSNALLTALDAGFLETLRDLRNKAAHPSGHHASAEEARFVFFEAVTRFLAKPILSTTQLADEVLASFTNANLFPINSIDVVTKVVQKELVNIHPETYPYLITKAMSQSLAEKVVGMNATFFLAGLARIGDAKAIDSLRKYAVEKMAPNKQYEKALVTLLSSNGKLFVALDEVTYQRLAVLVGDRIKNVELATDHTKMVHPASLFISLLEANPATFVFEKLGAQFDAFMDKFPYSAYFGKKVLSFEDARSKYLLKLYQLAGSSQFDVANAFAKHASDLDKVFGDDLRPAEAFRLLVNVLDAADTGAFAAIDLRTAHFAGTPKLRAKANEMLAKDLAAARAMAAEILGGDDKDLDAALSYLAPLDDA